MDKEKTSSQNINVDKNNNPFEEIVMIVENSKDRAYRKVNEELILMYQEVGKYISKKLKKHLMVPDLLIMWQNFFQQTILS